MHWSIVDDPTPPRELVRVSADGRAVGFDEHLTLSEAKEVIVRMAQPFAEGRRAGAELARLRELADEYKDAGKRDLARARAADEALVLERAANAQLREALQRIAEGRVAIQPGWSHVAFTAALQLIARRALRGQSTDIVPVTDCPPTVAEGAIPEGPQG